MGRIASRKAMGRTIIRESTKGPQIYDVVCKRVYLWDKSMGSDSREWWLVVRRNPESKKDYKYTLTNSAPTTSKDV